MKEGSPILDVHIVDCESPKSLHTLCEASTPPRTTTTTAPATSSNTDDYHDDNEQGNDDDEDDDNHQEDEQGGDEGPEVTYACHEYSEEEQADRESGWLSEREVCEGKPNRVFTGGNDTLAPGCSSCWCCTSNAESVCEGRDFPKDRCLSIGCCQWEGEEQECYSAVGQNPCRSNRPHFAAAQEAGNGTVELGSENGEESSGDGSSGEGSSEEWFPEEGSSGDWSSGDWSSGDWSSGEGSSEEGSPGEGSSGDGSSGEGSPGEEGGGANCTGGNDCCSATNACSEGAGDCDSDSDCIGDLRCGSNNCQGPGFDASDDCCYKEGT